MRHTPTLLCILDGWGHREDRTANAILQAETPVYDRLFAEAPRSWLKTSGLAVGLPEGQMGNSEVGHMNIGSGRVVMQDLPRINQASEDGSLAVNPVLEGVIASTKKAGGALHLLGLLSPGGVHSHMDHVLALARAIKDAGLRVHIHAILDGRDTPPKSAARFLADFERGLADLPGAAIATIGGRYFAMDRDQRWDRVNLAYQAMVLGKGKAAETAESALEAAYADGKSDEFVLPQPIADYAGMQAQDGLIMANFRADRARQIMFALADAAFDGFAVSRDRHPAAMATMTEYAADLTKRVPTLFPSEAINDSLGEVLARAGLPQLRIAETEKYAHVTFFFNGGSETIFDGEERALIPSPNVATYDLQPEMSAHEVTDKLVAAIESGKYATIIVNYANPDMVGHTGVLRAAIKAVETIDACLGRLEAAIIRAGGAMLITADHGNVELMTDLDTGEPHTAHTSFDVPLLMIGRQGRLENGALADLAPTLLDLMQIEKPTAMTGNSLWRGDEQATQAAE